MSVNCGNKNFKRISLALTENTILAIEDFFYLINRGYKRNRSLDFVTARYKLGRLERFLLYRSIFDYKTSRIRRKKMVDHREIRNKELLIDGFNVLSTIQSSLFRDVLVRGTDKIVRDLAAYSRKIKVSKYLLTSLLCLLSYISKVSPRRILIVFDSQVSRSSSILFFAKYFSEKMGIVCEGRLEQKTDKYIIDHGKDYIIASSDSVIIDNVPLIFDLGGKIAEIISMESIIDLSELLEMDERCCYEKDLSS
ncbi:MAG: hypothetical protein DRJ64_02430 [Thermoprotei archaeon]|nr:MAG: hypothetical protein DRJ64_02430 [Thermoprotei archaeon]